MAVNPKPIACWRQAFHSKRPETIEDTYLTRAHSGQLAPDRACRSRSCQHPRAPPRSCAPLSAVALEKAQRFCVELVDVFVNGSMGATLKDRQFAPGDGVLHRIPKAGGGDDVVATEGDLRRGLDSGKRGFGVVGDDRIRLAQESVERLCRTAAHKGGERLDIVRFRCVELRGKAPREYALD